MLTAAVKLPKRSAILQNHFAMLAPAYAHFGALGSSWSCQGAVHNFTQTQLITFLHLSLTHKHSFMFTPWTSLMSVCIACMYVWQPIFLQFSDRDRHFIQSQNTFVDLLDCESSCPPSRHDCSGSTELWNCGKCRYCLFSFSKHLLPHSIYTCIPHWQAQVVSSPPFYIVCFPLWRKCSQCQLTQSLSFLSPAEVILFKALTHCQGQRCTQTRLLMFHPGFIPLFRIVAVNSWHSILMSM